jgi:hypothetical protein
MHQCAQRSEKKNQWNTSATVNAVITSHLLVMACGTLMIECLLNSKIHQSEYKDLFTPGRSSTIPVKLNI